MTPRISTGRERRVAALPHKLIHEERRSGRDRRVASYRYFAQMLLREEEHTIHAPVVEDLILALRRPRGVVVVEGEYINGRVYPDNDAASYTAFGNRVKGLTDGHRVRVVVEKCDE